MSLKNKATQCYGYVPEHQYIPAGTLPFRSRHDDHSKSGQHVTWQDMYQKPASSKSSGFDSSSPTSVIEQARGDLYPHTPSPVCSPSPSSVTSPRYSTSSKELNSSELLPQGPEASSHSNAEKIPAEEGSSSKNNFLNSGEGGLLALLTSKLLSYKDSRLQHSGERSETSIHEKHVIEGDRGCKPPVEEILVDDVPQGRRQTLSHAHRRTPSDTPSEISLGSSNDRTLSMEFDAVLAAAVAAGIGQASVDNDAVAPSETIRVQLPRIEENRALRGSFSEREQEEIDGGDSRYALVPVTMNGDGIPEGTSTALAIVGHVTDEESSTTQSGRSFGSSSRGSERRTPEESVGSMRIQPESAVGREGRLKELGTESVDSSSRLSHDSSPDSCLSKTKSSGHNYGPVLPPSSRELALQKVRTGKILAKALALQEAKSAKYENRFKREESKIRAWENQQQIKASVSMKKIEMKLEQERAKAYEKMQNEIALAHKKAQERKATAAARKGSKVAKVEHQVERIKRTGKMPSGCLFF